jgi:hypothetical protein
MSRKIIRTTRRIQYNEDGEPVETYVSSTQQQPDYVLGPGEQVETYDPTADTRVTYSYPGPTTVTSPVETTVVHDWARNLRAATQRQFEMLREFDLRIGHLEDVTARSANSTSFERGTWWALWGVLMLLLGSALIVILLLIFTGLPR